jgi:hypothetical protein
MSSRERAGAALPYFALAAAPSLTLRWGASTPGGAGEAVTLVGGSETPSSPSATLPDVRRRLQLAWPLNNRTLSVDRVPTAWVGRGSVWPVRGNTGLALTVFSGARSPLRSLKKGGESSRPWITRLQRFVPEQQVGRVAIKWSGDVSTSTL